MWQVLFVDVVQEVPTCVSCAERVELAHCVQCWGCEAIVHEHCVVRKAHEVGLPWNCPACNRSLADVQDITRDVALLKFIMHGVLSEGLYKAARVEYAALFLHWWDGKLYIGPEQA